MIVGNCPRCGAPVRYLGLESRKSACINSRCSWPNPEPGTITTIRTRLKATADIYLQALRQAGRWPR